MLTAFNKALLVTKGRQLGC